MNDDNKKNEFLNEIQSKINKRSGGLYYNKKLKSIKKNLTITSLLVVFVIILWALINFVYQRISLNTKIISKTPVSSNDKKSGISNSILNESKKHSLEVVKKEEQKIIPKQKYRYIFTFSEEIKSKDSKLLKKILKKYKKTEGKEYFMFLIPESEIKNILKLISNTNLKLKKESYSDISSFYQISIKKEILDEKNEK